MNDAHAKGAVRAGHVLDLDDLAGHGGDRGFAVRQTRACVAGLAQGAQIEPRDGVAPDGDAAILMARLRHQYIGVARGLCLDQVAGRGGADLFVGGEQDGDGQGRLQARAHQLADRFKAGVIAALHVHQAGAIADVAVAFERQHL